MLRRVLCTITNQCTLKNVLTKNIYKLQSSVFYYLSNVFTYIISLDFKNKPINYQRHQFLTPFNGCVGGAGYSTRRPYFDKFKRLVCGRTVLNTYHLPPNPGFS